MLTLIKIQNIALIPSVEINFGGHFNVLTGETGAGKSIIIGSLNFIFGDKLSTTAIRGGADFARVTAVFDDTIITRTLRADGRSEICVNDEIVTIKTLREVSSHLIDIHGQHDTEKLLSPKNHIDILDSYGRLDLTEYRAEYGGLKSLERELSGFGDNDAERERLIDLYKYQIEEIEKAAITEAEEDGLNEKITVMRNSQKITENLAESVRGMDAADRELSRAIKHVGAISAFDNKLGDIGGRLLSAEAEITDIIITAKEYLESADFDDGDIDAVTDRLEVIKNIKRKYGKTAEEVAAFCDKTRKEYDRLTGAAKKIAELKSLIEKQTAAAVSCGEKLSAVRRDAAKKLETELLTHLADLGMPNARFNVRFNDGGDLHPNGIDEVEFYFTANLGEEVKPLSKIISGGEMSRLMLCIKTIANTDVNKTLVFDEIDTGISGAMGVAVANKLESLSKNSQIIAVTHLASIAAAADTHFLIEKSVTDNKTTTAVMPLSSEQRVTEIARIVGGGETAIAHARALLRR
jgi:DNA repair protein RecN (Recombination protein N)